MTGTLHVHLREKKKKNTELLLVNNKYRDDVNDNENVFFFFLFRNQQKKNQARFPLTSIQMSKKQRMKTYQQCVEKRNKNPSDKQRQKLCAEGYCTAKTLYSDYPSAYANGYASQVCKGQRKTFDGSLVVGNQKNPGTDQNLKRWFQEKWVNVCEEKKNGKYLPCGNSGPNSRKVARYCRPLHKLPGTKVVTVPELTKKEIGQLCDRKKQIVQKNGQSRTKKKLVLPPEILSRSRVPIPKQVRKTAAVGINLLKNGFKGGTSTGWARAKQLAGDRKISVADLKIMRAWFARHGPTASNGGTSYRGYKKWLKDGCPTTTQNKSKYRGAVAWLIWGGDAARDWVTKYFSLSK